MHPILFQNSKWRLSQRFPVPRRGSHPTHRGFPRMVPRHGKTLHVAIAPVMTTSLPCWGKDILVIIYLYNYIYIYTVYTHIILIPIHTLFLRNHVHQGYPASLRRGVCLLAFGRSPRTQFIMRIESQRPKNNRLAAWHAWLCEREIVLTPTYYALLLQTKTKNLQYSEVEALKKAWILKSSGYVQSRIKIIKWSKVCRVAVPFWLDISFTKRLVPGLPDQRGGRNIL